MGKLVITGVLVIGAIIATLGVFLGSRWPGLQSLIDKFVDLFTAR